MNQLAKKALQSVEFIAPLARMDPVYTEEEEAFKVCILVHQITGLFLVNDCLL